MTKKPYPKITTFLMFEGRAEEAMNYYTSIFKDSAITELKHQEDGKVFQAVFTINGQSFMCIDSPVNHGFTFTPAISLFVTFDTAEEVARVFHELSKDGEVMMPLDEYPFSKNFGWLADRFGVSWQLNLESE